MLQEGMQVILLGLQSSPELNFKLGVLHTYLHDRQRWIVELPCGRKVNVRQANMQTREVTVQNFYRVFGSPDQNTPMLVDLVEERMGKHGRYLVAKQTILENTMARDKKIRISMTPNENKQFVKRFMAFKDKQLGTALEFKLPESFNVTAAYIGMFVQRGFLENDLVRDLMDYDCCSPVILQETMERMHVEDFFLFDFWCHELPHVPADTLWHVQSFFMSHAFLYERTIVVGGSSKAACTQARWDFYSAIRRGEDPEPLPSTAEVYGNFTEMPSWLVQAQQGRGQFPIDDFVVFNAEIKKGEELLLDYGEDYFPKQNKQPCYNCPLALRPFLFRIVSQLDSRVTQALEAHMRG
jgi:hypothetical protein